MGVAPFTITLSDPLGKLLLSIPLAVGSACLEFLAPTGGMFSPGDTAVIHSIDLGVETAKKSL